MTKKNAEDTTTSVRAMEEAMEKIRTQVSPKARELLAKLEQGVASGAINRAELDQILAKLEQLDDSLPQ